VAAAERKGLELRVSWQWRRQSPDGLRQRAGEGFRLAFRVEDRRFFCRHECGRAWAPRRSGISADWRERIL